MPDNAIPQEALLSIMLTGSLIVIFFLGVGIGWMARGDANKWKKLPPPRTVVKPARHARRHQEDTRPFRAWGVRG